MAETIESLQQQLERLVAEAETAVASARDVAAVENLRVQYLGKKGVLTEQLKQVGALSAAKKRMQDQALDLHFVCFEIDRQVDRCATSLTN